MRLLGKDRLLADMVGTMLVRKRESERRIGATKTSNWYQLKVDTENRKTDTNDQTLVVCLTTRGQKVQ